MSDIKVEYKEGKGFWIDEDYMIILFQYILDELKQPRYNFKEKAKILDEAEILVSGLNPGIANISWNELLNGHDEEAEMVRVLEAVIRNLRAKGSYISVDELQRTPTRSIPILFAKNPLLTSELINIIVTLILMLEGKWHSTNHNFKVAYSWETSPEDSKRMD